MTELPSGAVTFLFSDIEGSTRLVKALRERYAQVLAEHRQMVRAVIAQLQVRYLIHPLSAAIRPAFRM